MLKIFSSRVPISIFIILPCPLFISTLKKSPFPNLSIFCRYWQIYCRCLEDSIFVSSAFSQLSPAFYVAWCNAEDGVRRKQKKVRWTFFPSNRPTKPLTWRGDLGPWCRITFSNRNLRHSNSLRESSFSQLSPHKKRTK